MKLVIIEGAGKKETIEKYLGNGYKVFATKGHIRDLPVKSIAINVKKNFEPKYEIMEDKAQIAEQLKREAGKAKDGILLATDPDREGEAISWHVAHILDIDATAPVRIVFNEISKKAITTALANPRPIDQSLVDAQQARRVLDRLVGYKVSPVLCKKIQSKLSAGRVQSVTLKLVVDREREIRAFIPEEYWPFASILNKAGDSTAIKAVLAKKEGEKYKLVSKEMVDETLAGLNGKEYKVASVKKSITKARPMPPFITSSLQQDALNKLGFSLKQTSSVAQTLYEGVDVGPEGKVALVTYIRTDSTRVAPDAIASAREFIGKKYGADYVPEKPNFYASKKGAQDAHEAIRPINLDRTPESLKGALAPPQFKLYKLIYERFLASQMSDATYNSLAVEIEAGIYGFKVTGKTPLFPGYTAVYNFDTSAKKGKNAEDSEEDEENTNAKIPDLVEGEILNFVEYKYEQKFTKPPTRYTEASLVKAMEEKGIGRPATYTPTISVLTSRTYCSKEGRYLVPSELGEKVTDMLVKYFPDIMDVLFTAKMEDELDTIEDGGVIWQGVVGKYYEGLEEKIANALGDEYTLKEPPVETDIPCDKCGVNMVIRSGRFGQFLACPGFPKCKNIKNIVQPAVEAVDGISVPPPSEYESAGSFDGAEPNINLSNINEGQTMENTKTLTATKIVVQEQQNSGIFCEKCGKEMILRNGKYGSFHACPGYPACKNIKDIKKEEDENAGNCPKCSKPLGKRFSKGKPFYGCSGYPDCSFASNLPLSDEKCPDCGSYTTVRKGAETTTIICGAKGCKFKK
ncbi:MAG: type I DNA topoisomerase [Firmicutes bacterium]|nr:type I DNA topoisomerase [Bacillota bacterium]